MGIRVSLKVRLTFLIWPMGGGGCLFLYISDIYRGFHTTSISSFYVEWQQSFLFIWVYGWPSIYLMRILYASSVFYSNCQPSSCKEIQACMYSYCIRIILPPLCLLILLYNKNRWLWLRWNSALVSLIISGFLSTNVRSYNWCNLNVLSCDYN